MANSRVLILGGTPDQLHQLATLMVGTYDFSIFPEGYLLSEQEIYPGPSLILFIPENPSDDLGASLKNIRKKLPDTPVVFLAENPGKADIIRAFRFGIADYLLFPLQGDEFLQVLESRAKNNRLWFSALAIQKWRARLRYWLGRRPERSQAQQPPGLPGGFPFSPEAVAGKQFHEVEVRFFGNFCLTAKGKTLSMLPGEKINTFFAYLLYNHLKPVHREILLSKFWDYTSPSAARNSLNVAMHTLRRHLHDCLPEMEFLHYNNDSYSINAELDVITDVDQFQDCWRRGQAIELNHGPQQAIEYYQNAAALYRGDFLEDIHYEEWCELERDNLKETYLILLDRMGTYFLREEAYAMAGKVFKKMLDKDICLENVHRKLILCYYRLGRRDNAIRQYYKCAQALRKELNIEPSQPTRELFRLVQDEKGIPLFLL